MAPLLVFLGFLALGLYGMAPSVSFGDSGELSAAAAVLGVAHAPGYPLFSLAARALGDAVPWGSWAYRTNLLSALSGAAALTLLFDAARRAGCGRLAAVAGCLTLAASPLWLHTTLQTEVFALNSLFAAGALWIACRWPASLFSPRPMAALGLWLGLGGGNHQTLVLIAPAVLAAGWLGQRPSPRRVLRGLAYLAGFGLLGLAVYLYLPLRARAAPPLDWGHPVDLPRFLHVLLRRDYGSFSLTVEGAAGGRLAGVWAQTLRYLRASWETLGPAGASLALFGVAVARSPLLLLWIVLSGPAFLWLGNPPFDAQTSGALERFYLLSWIGGALAAARGASWLLDAAPWPAWRPALALLLLSAPAVRAARTRPAWDQRRDLAAYDYGRNLLRSLPPGSTLYIDGGDDAFYTTAYLLFAERRRPDVTPHDRGGLVFRSPYGPDFRRLPKAQKERRRLAVEARSARSRPVFYATLQDRILPGHRLELWGLLRRPRALHTPQGRPEERLVEAPEGRALWELYPVRFQESLARAHYRYRALIPVYSVLRAAADTSRGAVRAAALRLETALDLGPDVLWLPGAVSARAQWAGYFAAQAGEWAAAEAAYRAALRADSGREDVRRNLRVTLERQGR